MTFEDALPVLIDLGNKYEFRPDLPVGMEEFFTHLLREYEGDESSLLSWLETRVASEFTCMEDRPDWLQDPEWPISRKHGVPMIFVGQIDRRTSEFKSSFYVFKERDCGVTKVVIQVVT